MTSTANNAQPAAEHPLTWTSGKVWGSEGLTHRSTTEIHGETWKFTVDQPSKGHWVARAWRDGDFALYREDTTLTGAKAQAQAHANLAAEPTWPECSETGDREPDAAPGVTAEVTEVQDSAVSGPREQSTGPDPLTAYGTTEIGPAILDRLDTAEAAQLVAELEATFPHLTEWQGKMREASQRAAGHLGQASEATVTQVQPAAEAASEGMARIAAAVAKVQAARDRVQFRKDTCGCLTPLHTMRCGAGGRARVVTKAGA